MFGSRMVHVRIIVEVVSTLIFLFSASSVRSDVRPARILQNVSPAQLGSPKMQQPKHVLVINLMQFIKTR